MDERAPQHPEHPSRPISVILRDFFVDVVKIIRSEALLAETKLRENTRSTIHQAVELALIITITGLGALSLLVYSILWLGNQLSQRYDLSALIIGFVLFIPGVFLLMKRIQKFQ